MKKIVVILLIVFVGVGGYYLGTLKTKTPKVEDKQDIRSFEDCMAAGYPILESFPRQCKSGTKTYTEDVGNSLEKSDLIKLDYPKPNQKIVSPLLIQGKARGNWYFEAQFPVVLKDDKGNVLAQFPAKAQGDWMSPDFVPFTVSMVFTKPQSGVGQLVLKKDNPSGLPENEDELRIPVNF